MADPQTFHPKGQSGKQYTYYIWPIDTVWDPKQVGNYIFTRAVPIEGGGDTHYPVYIGETGDGFRERFANHEKMACIRREGATHVTLHVRTDKAAREAEATDLLKGWSTPCYD